MKRIIEFPLEGTTETILVEVEQEEGSGMIKASRGSDIVEKASMTLEEAVDKVKPAAEAILKKLRSLSDTPDEISVVFGLKLNAQAGVVMASAGLEANYTVTMKWTKGK